MLRSSSSDLVPASPGYAPPTISRLNKTSPPRSARSTTFPADGSFKDRVNVLLPPRTMRTRLDSRQPLGPSRQQGSGTMHRAGLRDRALSGPSKSSRLRTSTLENIRSNGSPGQRPPLNLSMPPGYERCDAELTAGYQDDRLFDDLYVNAVYRGRQLDAPRPPTNGVSHNAGVLVNGALVTANTFTDPSGFREPLDSLGLPAYGAQRHFGLHADGTSRQTAAAAGPSRPDILEPSDLLRHQRSATTHNAALLGDRTSEERDTLGAPSSAMQPLGTLKQPISETIRNADHLNHGTPRQIAVVAGRSREHKHRNPMLELEGQVDPLPMQPLGLLQQQGSETTLDFGHYYDSAWRQTATVAGPSTEYRRGSAMLEFEGFERHASPGLMQPLGPWFGRFGNGNSGEVDTLGGSSDRQALAAREEPARILFALEAFQAEEAVKFRRSTVPLIDDNAHSSRLQQPASGASENTGLDDDELMRARSLVGSPRIEARLLGLTFESESSSQFQEVVDSLPLHEKRLRTPLKPKLPEARASTSHPMPPDQANDCPQEADMESPYKPEYPAAEHRTQMWVDGGGHIEILRDRRGRPRQGTEIGWGGRDMQDLLQQALKTPMRETFVPSQPEPQLGTGITSAKAPFVHCGDDGTQEEQAGSGLYSSILSEPYSSVAQKGMVSARDKAVVAVGDSMTEVDGGDVLIVMDRGDPQASVGYSSTETKKNKTSFFKSPFSDKKSKTLMKTRNKLPLMDAKESGKASSVGSSVGPSLLDREPKQASRRKLPSSPIDTTKTELNFNESSVSQPTQSSLRKQREQALKPPRPPKSSGAKQLAVLPKPSMSGRKYNPRASVGGLTGQLRAPATIAVTKDGEQETTHIGDINSAFFYSKLWPGQNIPPSMNDDKGSLFRSMQPLARNEGYLNMRGITPRQAFIQDFGQKWAQEYDEFVKHWEIVEAEYGKPNAMIANALLDQPAPLPEDPAPAVKKSHTQNIVSGFKKSLSKSGLSNLAKMPSSMHLPINQASGSRSTSGPAALEQSKKPSSRPISPCEIFDTENFKFPEEEEKNVYVAMSKIYWFGRFNTLNTNRMNEELAMKRMTGLAVKYSTKSQNGSDANHAHFDELWDQEEIERAVDVFEEMWQRCKTVEARRSLKDYKIHFVREKKLEALLPEGVPMDVPVVRGMAAVAGRMLGTGENGYREMQLQRREQREVDRVLAAIRSKNPGPSRLPVVTGGERKWPWLKKENRRPSEQNL